MVRERVPKPPVIRPLTFDGAPERELKAVAPREPHAVITTGKLRSLVNGLRTRAGLAAVTPPQEAQSCIGFIDSVTDAALPTAEQCLEAVRALSAQIRSQVHNAD